MVGQLSGVFRKQTSVSSLPISKEEEPRKDPPRHFSTVHEYPVLDYREIRRIGSDTDRRCVRYHEELQRTISIRFWRERSCHDQSGTLYPPAIVVAMEFIHRHVFDY